MTPIHYVGNVWCIRVPTGAFVARRNGKVFVTGNSGFPKSLDVSKAIDAQDAVQEQQARRYKFTAWVRSTGVTAKQIDTVTATSMGNHYTTHPTQPAIMTREHLEACRHLLGEVPEWVERECDIRSIESQTLKNREVVGIGKGVISNGEGRYNWHAEGTKGEGGAYNITAPATEAAQQWAGWGTALKPSLEPITVARKPLGEKTVAANVLAHGTGAINVDGCRVGTETIQTNRYTPGRDMTSFHGSQAGNEYASSTHAGRWPANLIHDGSDEVVGLFPEDGDASAARFFYCAKADASERRNSKHPTIKPVALMRYLVRLVTPPGGLVLDPFGGSGATAEAARLEHCRFLLMELNPEYCADAAERLRQGVLF